MIVGGGSSGWITAATFLQRLNAGGHPPVAISLIESPTTPRIGVGEATIPTIRNLLKGVGLSEAAFLRGCEATFKHAIRFDDWAGPGSRTLHPFHRHQSPLLDGALGAWLAGPRARPFDDLVSLQGDLIDRNLAPRGLSDPDYGGAIPYAYHMDAEMFGDLLAAHCAARGVTHLRGHVTQVARREDGSVSALRLEDGRLIEADLYVDCTGFRALLAPDQTDWIDQSDHLLCDRAVAMRVPNAEGAVPLPFTRARALSAGWCWDIGLQSRRGRGYVFSSRFLSDEAAESELRADEGPGCAGIPARIVRFRVGRRAAPWVGNVVCIGLSAGFLEPLESTGLFLSDFAARALCEFFPRGADPAAMAGLAWRHNQLMGELHDTILDFILFHYAVAGRRDTEFWRQAGDPARLTPQLAGLMEVWRSRPPSFADFSQRFAPFSHQNYEFILAGSSPGYGRAGPAPVVPPELEFQRRKLVTSLPGHAELIRALSAAG
nr:tryptophan halogenase family protein [Halovulum dunhuangense]